MLYFSAVLSVPVFALALISARREPHRVRWGVFAAGSAMTGLLSVCSGVFLSTLAPLIIVWLAVALAIWPRVRRRIDWFAPLALAAGAGAFGCACVLSLPTLLEYDRLRLAYPIESMEDRVPAPRPAGQTSGGPSETARETEDSIETAPWAMRARALEQLHGNATRLFVNSPGFGVGRMYQPAEWNLKPQPRDAAPAQPGPDSPPAASQSAATSAADMHRAGVLDFVNPKGFGFVRDRRHAAGFQPHGFTSVPGPTVRYQVERVELVGLLLHPEPVVYVSDTLPEMTAVRTTPTRPLDDFEAAALAELHAGKDLIERDDRTPARLMGSLRNGKQCVTCHGGERGDLLGAFSYMLRVR